MQVETVQTEELSQLDKLINEVIEQRKVVDIKLNTIVFQEKVLYTALVILDD
jgi:acetolactate synthase small subunit